MRFDKVATVNRLLDGLDPAALTAPVREMLAEGEGLVSGAGVTLSGVETGCELDMHYLGQTHTVAVPLALQGDAADLGLDEGAVRRAFEAAYRRAYGKVLTGLGVRILNVRVSVVGKRPGLRPGGPGAGPRCQCRESPARHPRGACGGAGADGHDLGPAGPCRSGRRSPARRCWSSQTRRSSSTRA